MVFLIYAQLDHSLFKAASSETGGNVSEDVDIFHE